MGWLFCGTACIPIVLPALLLNFAPKSLKNTYLGGLIFSGLILAMLIQPLSGALSDRTRSSWGQRRPWILAGTLLSLVFLAGMPLSGNLWGLLAAYLFLQVASNTAHGPAQGLIPDLVVSERRGLASGIKNLFDMGGLIVTSLVAGQLMGDENPSLEFVVIGIVVAISSMVTIFGTPEAPPSV